MSAKPSKNGKRKVGTFTHTLALNTGIGGDANQYLLFEREKGKKMPFPVEAAAAG
jgi:hypothetical protein